MGLARRTANRQAIRRASLHVKFRPPARRPNRQTNRWCRPVPASGVAGRTSWQLSRESELFVRCYVFVRCLTRPPDNLGMPLTPTPPSRIRFAPGRRDARQRHYTRTPPRCNPVNPRACRIHARTARLPPVATQRPEGGRVAGVATATSPRSRFPARRRSRSLPGRCC